MLGCSALIATAPAFAQDATVKVTDKTFDTGASQFAYTEYELSGEPLAEGLGLNLDVLDPDQADKPDAFDFAAGIDSYEYSEEAMYAVNYQSKMGPHLANGPVNAKAGGTLQDLGKRVIHLADSVGFAPDELPQNFYPITFPVAHAMPEFGQKVDVSAVSSEKLDILTHTGDEKSIDAVTPAYFRDYGTLGWKASGMDDTFTPVAVGGEMLKDVMWAQDFLGGMHVQSSDAEVDDISSSDMDHDGKHKLGVSAADGVNGMLLTEISWDRLLMLRNRFGYDGESLGARISPDYDATKDPVWFPAKVAVDFTQKNGVKALGDLKVEDGASTLRASWMMLWPLAELYGYTDQRTANENQNKAFLAVFDGDPFPAAPEANRATKRSGYERADDPFSLVETLSNVVFQNMKTLHYDKKDGTLVDRWPDGEQGKTVTAFDAAYSLVALDIYHRAIDALPVGYASASSGKPLDTEQGKEALDLLKNEADFIVDKLVGDDGLVADSYTVGKGASDSHSLGTQFAAIRGLAAAFVATDDTKYRKAARGIYEAVNKTMVDAGSGLYNPTPGKPFTVTPWTAGAVSGGLRALLQTLYNQEDENAAGLDRAALAQHYTTWFHTVGRGMQLAEWLADTGEHYVKGGNGDVNRNGIKELTAAGGEYGTAPVMAGKVTVEPAATD
ncbi:hypothetical protein FJU11_00800 [Pararhizobium mangrovi]|uniref:Uncharacterized protein n=1 Tax=Pararhizobium mangrovi TaxID=2590452 RepID=A0A506UI60_9HYPH|nr:hypothetical protein FJU11_00800 [Pararhizobium mangrovi]